MGLFDDPFRFCNEEREKQQWNNQEHLKAAREMAEKSIVLLKNEKQLLPLPIDNTEANVKNNCIDWSICKSGKG